MVKNVRGLELKKKRRRLCDEGAKSRSPSLASRMGRKSEKRREGRSKRAGETVSVCEG